MDDLIDDLVKLINALENARLYNRAGETDKVTPHLNEAYDQAMFMLAAAHGEYNDED